MRARTQTQGFTLVELMIAIAIISILAGLTIGGVLIARQRAYVVTPQTSITLLHHGLMAYVDDRGCYPGASVPDDENALPELVEALVGQKPPEGRGGRNSPCLDLKQVNLRTLDPSTGEMRPVRPREVLDPELPKLVVDAWGMPLWYRVNKGKELTDYRRNLRSADIWSTGPDRRNQSQPRPDPGDRDGDLGNW
jgi:prepilin-type N-terminal cleavage/methylation domain-containing protein